MPRIFVVMDKETDPISPIFTRLTRMTNPKLWITFLISVSIPIPTGIFVWRFNNLRIKSFYISTREDDWLVPYA
jgi:hypothetical protein